MGTYISADAVPGVDNADELIDELEVHLALHFPCITPDMAAGQLIALEALLKPIVRRWADVGTGVVTTRVAGPFREDVSAGGGHVLLPYEQTALLALCGLSSVGAIPRGSFPPAEPITDVFVRRPGWLAL